MANPFSFYQVSSVILNKLGVECACLHAVIRNKSKTIGYECKLSEAQIGNEIHMSYKRVEKYLAILLEEGYIRKTNDVNEYGTKSYIYVPEMVDGGLNNEDKVTLTSNDKRISQSRKQKIVERDDANPNKNHHTPCDNPLQPAVTVDPNKRDNDVTFCTTINNNKQIDKEIIKGDGKKIDSKITRLQEIKAILERKFTIIADDKRWDDFINFAYKRERSHGQKIERFIQWALEHDDFNPVYWTPEKMKTIYPQAFIEDECFCPPLPPRVEKVVVPMPEDLKPKRSQW